MLEIIISSDVLAPKLLDDFHGLVPHGFVDCDDEDLWTLLDVGEKVFPLQGQHESFEAACHPCCWHVPFSVDLTQFIESAASENRADVFPVLVVSFEHCSVIITYSADDTEVNFDLVFFSEGFHSVDCS